MVMSRNFFIFMVSRFKESEANGEDVFARIDVLTSPCSIRMTYYCSK